MQIYSLQIRHNILIKIFEKKNTRNIGETNIRAFPITNTKKKKQRYFPLSPLISVQLVFKNFFYTRKNKNL